LIAFGDDNEHCSNVQVPHLPADRQCHQQKNVHDQSRLVQLMHRCFDLDARWQIGDSNKLQITRWKDTSIPPCYHRPFEQQRRHFEKCHGKHLTIQAIPDNSMEKPED
jgi:hypothetical protein